jgi:hypothetical protein
LSWLFPDDELTYLPQTVEAAEEEVAAAEAVAEVEGAVEVGHDLFFSPYFA